MKKFLSTVLKYLYAPIYILGVILHRLARLALALAYLMMLQKRQAYDIIKHFL